jgi:hypothetical protein
METQIVIFVVLQKPLIICSLVALSPRWFEGSWQSAFSRITCRSLMNNFGPGLLRLCPGVSMCICLAWQQYAGLPGSSVTELVLRKFCLRVLMRSCYMRVL